MPKVRILVPAVDRVLQRRSGARRERRRDTVGDEEARVDIGRRLRRERGVHVGEPSVVVRAAREAGGDVGREETDPAQSARVPELRCQGVDDFVGVCDRVGVVVVVGRRGEGLRAGGRPHVGRLSTAAERHEPDVGVDSAAEAVVQRDQADTRGVERRADERIAVTITDGRLERVDRGILHAAGEVDDGHDVGGVALAECRLGRGADRCPQPDRVVGRAQRDLYRQLLVGRRCPGRRIHCSCGGDNEQRTG